MQIMRYIPAVMKPNPLKTFAIAVALCALGAGLRAADSAPAKDAKPTAPAPTAAAAAKDAAASAANVQKLMQQFNTKRDAMIANRDALAAQLKSATEAEKKAILDKMETQQKELLEVQRALGKQIRDEKRKLRPSATPPGR